MINNFFKTIHNKYYKVFRFIFFLRYLLAIFFTAIVLFLTIPFFFDYEKKIEIIKNRLSKSYNFKIDKYEKIKFKPLPYPILELKNVLIKNDLGFSKFEVKNLKIVPKIFSIYNFEELQVNKIVLKKSNIEVEDLIFESNLRQLFFQKNKLLIDNLNIKILDKKSTLINIENLRYANFGYNKNLIIGKIFNKKFKTKIDDNFNNLNFRLLGTGLIIDINFEKNNENFVKGILKSKILNSNLKFNFEYNDKTLKIYNSYFRNKNITFKNESLIILKPYLDIMNKINIQEIESKIFDKIKIEKILKEKSILKKINSKNEIFYKRKKFNSNLIDELNIKIDLAYGRLNLTKNLFISKNLFKCRSDVNLLEDYPLLSFDCLINFTNKNKFLNNLSLKNKKENQNLILKIRGTLNILNKKINFKEIKTSQNYLASKEDLKYFKDTFETIFLSENYLKMFSLRKIKEFIVEIS